MLGVIIVVIITNSLIRLGLRSGASSLVLGTILLIAVAIDVRWVKNRAKLLARSYVSPTYFALPPLLPASRDPASPYAINDLLSVAEPIGVGQVDGPEDVILDADGNLYCGSRDGDIIRFFAPDHRQREVYVHIGGQTLGLAFDRDGSLLVCVGGMGLYKLTPDRQVIKLSDETNRSWLSVVDDSRMRLADDLDIAPDGRVFFSEATIRYEPHDWIIDALEGRGNGRIICYDLRDGSSRTVLPGLQFPNGICMVPDGASFLFAETWACRISRYYHDGPHKGRVESVIPDLPGYPDNINRASDGNFWCGIIGMRAKAFDMAQKMPGFRRRLVMQIARDKRLYTSRLISAGDGWWMCVFVPRNQLSELVLREAAYRNRMMAEVDPQWWVAPALPRATSFYEPMQGGAIRTHGIVNPWAPTRSYGLLVRLDTAFRPISSYHSRADGWFHGITSALPFGDRVLVASRGGNAILSLSEVQA